MEASVSPTTSPAKRYVLPLFIAIASLTACDLPEPDEATVKVLDATPKNDFPEVVELVIRGATCKGTFVSSTTAITAARCVTGDFVAFNGLFPMWTWIHPEFGTNRQNDIAVLVWETPIHSHFATVSTSSFDRNDTGVLEIVGSGVGAPRFLNKKLVGISLEDPYYIDLTTSESQFFLHDAALRGADISGIEGYRLTTSAP